jgi:hypothetical protein
MHAEPQFSRWRIPIWFSAVSLLFSLMACPGSRSTKGQGPTAHFEVTADVIAFDNERGQPISLGADWVRDERAGSDAPLALFIPGSGRTSRRGETRGDGDVKYPHPVDVTALWVSTAVQAGFSALTLDKRTCLPSDHPGCLKNADADLKALGPGALAADVDAACSHAIENGVEPRRLVVVARDQAAQVVLASDCAKRAGAVVLLSPIPGAVDEVMVEGMLDRAQSQDAASQHAAKSTDKAAHQKAVRNLINKAESLRETFASMKTGKFPHDAEVMGTPVSFWLGWMALTERTPELLGEAPRSTFVVMGDSDSQYAKAHRDRFRSWAKNAGIHYESWPQADHHLLVGTHLKKGSALNLWKRVKGALPKPYPS